MWRTIAKDAALTKTKITHIYAGSKYWCDRSAPCDWTAETFQVLTAYIADKVPPGRMRDEAQERIARLNPAQKSADEVTMEQTWREWEAASPRQAEFEAERAAQWQIIACDLKAPLHVAYALIPRFMNARDSSFFSTRGQLAAAFLAPTCLGTQGLSKHMTAELIKLRDAPPSVPLSEIYDRRR